MYNSGCSFAFLSGMRVMFVSHFSGFCDRSFGPGLQPTDQVFKHVGEIAKSDC